MNALPFDTEPFDSEPFDAEPLEEVIPLCDPYAPIESFSSVDDEE